jgi:hypothetical protein
MKQLLLLSLLVTSILNASDESKNIKFSNANYTTKTEKLQGFTFTSNAPTRVSVNANHKFWSAPQSNSSSKFSDFMTNDRKNDLILSAATTIASHLLPKMLDSACDLTSWSFKLVKSSIDELNSTEEERVVHVEERVEIMNNINNSVSILNHVQSIEPEDESYQVLDGLDGEELKMLAESEMRKNKPSTYFRTAYRNYLISSGQLYPTVGIGSTYRLDS